MANKMSLEDIAYTLGLSEGRIDLAIRGGLEDSPLSGEWADGRLCQDVIRAVNSKALEAGIKPLEDDNDMGETSVLDSWENGYFEAGS